VRIYFRAGYNDDDAIALQVSDWLVGQSPAPMQSEIDAYEASLRRVNVPRAAKAAMRQYLAHWYEHREAATAENLKEAPKMVDILLWTLRVEDHAPTRG
jgi:hypothetical protein